MPQLTRNLGKVYLVAAGPGDPGLISIRGDDCLRRADLVLVDGLVNPALLRHVPPSAEIVCLGDQGAGRSVSQEEIQRKMVQAATQGSTVVLLKSDNSMSFGCGASETQAFRAAGIPYEIVPGIPTAAAASGYAEIPLFHPNVPSAVALIAGEEQQGRQGSAQFDYGALAEFPGTLVLPMGATSVRQWSDSLMGRGKPADTPVAVIRHCVSSKEAVIRCTLGRVAEEIAERQLSPPAVIVVGEVARLGSEVSWFSARPLFGVRVLVTRPRDQAEEMCQHLMELGADVLLQPAIVISDPSDWQPVDCALDHLESFDWVVFSSANGVRQFLDRLGRTADLRRLGRVRIAAIGPGTADELARYRLRADRIPSQYRAESLAESLAGEAQGQRFLLIRASRGREVLAERLSAAGAQVEQVVVYTNTDVPEADPQVAAALASGQIDWVTVTSSTIARSLVRLLGERLRGAKLVSISPLTSDVLRGLGHPPAAEAIEYTTDGVVEAILNHGRPARRETRT